MLGSPVQHAVCLAIDKGTRTYVSLIYYYWKLLFLLCIYPVWWHNSLTWYKYSCTCYLILLTFLTLILIGYEPQVTLVKLCINPCLLHKLCAHYVYLTFEVLWHIFVHHAQASGQWLQLGHLFWLSYTLHHCPVLRFLSMLTISGLTPLFLTQTLNVIMTSLWQHPHLWHHLLPMTSSLKHYKYALIP